MDEVREITGSDFNGHIRMKMWEGKSLMASGNAEENVVDCTMAFDLSIKGTHTKKRGTNIHNLQQQRNIKSGRLYFMWKDCKVFIGRMLVPVSKLPRKQKTAQRCSLVIV